MQSDSGVGGGEVPDVAIGGDGSAKTGVASVEAADVTVVISRIPGYAVAATAGISVGLNLDLPNNALKARIILEGNNKVLICKGNFGGEGGDGEG